MILTCPECATSYFVDDGRIPADGRQVKCASCGARWLARPEPAPDPEPVLDDLVAEPAPAPPDDPAPLPAEDVEIVAEPSHLRPRPPRPAPPLTPARARGRGKALAWIAAAASVALVIAGALVFRAEVMRLWPPSSAAYAGLGLAAPDAGLSLEGLKAAAAFQAGRPVLDVTGAIRNTQAESRPAPALRFSLVDAHGKALAAQVAQPEAAAIPAGGVRYFQVSIPNPPAGAADLRVTFEPAARAHAQPAHAAPAPVGPAPVKAAHGPSDHG